MPAKKASRKSTPKPTVDGVGTLVMATGTETDEEFVEAVQALFDSYKGATLVVGWVDESDADESEEDDEEEDDEEEEDEESDEEDEDEESDEGYTEDELAEMGSDDLKAVLKDWEIELEGRFSQKKAIAAILEAQEGDEEDEEEDEEEDDEEEGETIDEETVADMGLTELKALYKELTGKVARKGMKAASLREKILEFAEEE